MRPRDPAHGKSGALGRFTGSMETQLTRRITLLQVAALCAVAILALLAVSAPGFAATRYWVGGSGNFTDSSHWSASSGGSGGASVPGSGDDARVTAASGSASLQVNQDVAVRDFVIESSASGGFTIDFGTSRLQCTRDCLFRSGRVDQGQAPGARLVAGRDLDTAACQLSGIRENELSIELSGTGTWRYSLANDRQPRIWNLVAAQPGQTTTLRPVGAVPIGTDIDIENQLVLGNGSSVLDMDLSEANSPQRLTIEIHSRQQALDVAATGARVRIDSIEHEMTGPGPGLLQHQISYEGLSIFDVTGSHGAPVGNGPRWSLTGPLDLGNASLAIEKTVVLDTEGYDLDAGGIVVGGGSLGTAEFVVPGGQVNAAGTLTLGVGSGRYGRIRLEGGGITASDLEVRAPDGRLTGTDGSFLELLGAAASVGTVYYVSASGNDNNNGLSSGQPFRTFGRGAGALGSGTTVLFRRGDTWDLGSGVSVDANGGAIGAYGNGPAPVLHMNPGGTMTLSGGRWTAHDLRVEFGNVSGGGGGGGGGPEPPTAPILLQ